RGSRGRAGDGDLVTADVDIRGELPLDGVKQFVPGSEQANHGMAVGNNDSDRGTWTVTAGFCQFTALEGPGTAPRASCGLLAAAGWRPSRPRAGAPARPPGRPAARASGGHPA